MIAESLLEDEILVKEFSEICRTCLNKERLEPFEQHPSLQLYRRITNLKVDVKEELPMNICYNCSRKLSEVSMFITISKINDEYLRQILHKSKAQVVPIEVIDICEETGRLNSDDESNSFQFKNMETPFECEVCTQHFETRGKLSAHQKTSESCKSKCRLHECKICLKKFRQSQNLKRHDNIVHKGLKPYKCEICAKVFSRQITKNEHVSSHKAEKLYSCKLCHEAFSTYRNYFAHLYLHKIEIGKITNTTLQVNKSETGQLVAKCTVCKKLFSAPRAAYQHTHDEKASEQKFLCNICGKTFKRKEQFQTHSRLHSGEKPFECKTCGKQFRFESGFRSHKLLHTGQKPHSCSICERNFVQSAHLKQHMRMHSGEKPYECSLCQKRFAQKCNLVVHERIHTGCMPFQCSVCNKGFYHSTTMKKHEKIHRNYGGTEKKNLILV